MEWSYDPPHVENNENFGQFWSINLLDEQRDEEDKNKIEEIDLRETDISGVDNLETFRHAIPTHESLGPNVEALERFNQAILERERKSGKIKDNEKRNVFDRLHIDFDKYLHVREPKVEFKMPNSARLPEIVIDCGERQIQTDRYYHRTKKPKDKLDSASSPRNIIKIVSLEEELEMLKSSSLGSPTVNNIASQTFESTALNVPSNSNGTSPTDAFGFPPKNEDGKKMTPRNAW